MFLIGFGVFFFFRGIIMKSPINMFVLFPEKFPEESGQTFLMVVSFAFFTISVTMDKTGLSEIT